MDATSIMTNLLHQKMKLDRKLPMMAAAALATAFRNCHTCVDRRVVGCGRFIGAAGRDFAISKKHVPTPVRKQRAFFECALPVFLSE